MLKCGAAAMAVIAAPRQPVFALAPAVKVGEFELATLSDGYLTLAAQNFGVGIPADHVSLALGEAAKVGGKLDGTSVVAPVNVILVRRGADVTLIDAGAGGGFMDTSGRLSQALEAAKIAPAAVTRVIFTHGHPDHLWGVIDEFDDSLRFPNAEYVMSEAEWALWMTGDPASKVPATRSNFIPGAKRVLGRIKDRLKLVKPGQEAASGMVAVDSAGHSQGHMSIMLNSGGDRLLVLGDALIHPIVSFQYPEWPMAADHEPERGSAARRAILEVIINEKLAFFGTHLPGGGFGRAERRAKAYNFLAGLK
ncbi:MAG TPA: MBL fold metallo-hydrolase [Hyphomicrobiaceae bacterium]|nr:MBL fold metallo-hydrolase [Hyphomicrobiaceae bacterium]